MLRFTFVAKVGKYQEKILTASSTSSLPSLRTALFKVCVKKVTCSGQVVHKFHQITLISTSPSTLPVASTPASHANYEN
jgi:hypothetical protein